MQELTQEEKRIELINDLIACTTVMEEIWRYHPDNPKVKDVVTEYEVLEEMKTQIEEELKNHG